jgi:hypothetical protein
VIDCLGGTFIDNHILRTEKFKSLYKKKRKEAPTYLIEKVDRAILHLRTSEWPERLGRRKHAPLAGLLGYEINRDNRILYEVSRSEEGVLVILHRVCSHKVVYGKN